MSRSVVIVAFPDAELLDIACPSDVLDVANRHGARPRYDIRLASLDGKPIRCQSGLTLAAQLRLDRLREPLDTLIVAGGTGHEDAARDPRFITHVRRVAGLSRRVASVCTGATVLAAAGLLNNRRATTHWRYAGRLARAYPEVTVDPSPLYVRDGHVYTGAGVTSGLDLTLALVEEDHGPSLAREVARSLVTYLQRPGNQAQVSMFLAAPPPENRVIADLAAHIAGRLDEDLSTPALAGRAGLSVRQLTRLFSEHLGRTPGKHVRAVRTEAASQLLATTDLPLSAVARRCGFGSTETLRQAFLEHYGTPPSAYRRVHRKT
ncbi:GlxA family transcriptional regulator [Amycolatopsis sp. K13G38]|uniref:GlxA family transcriptional regulator n=1 Tax=Amycolatopsis acididurans TaxID=2724524 RepID=A0ABX1JKC6_9PSEU|nr:GlxA family transcriptional regulator [Amycolatopsis acididurans]NKQ59375.1 GlxA family transcriptional regulator [Amycolatopsis acididurans]